MRASSPKCFLWKQNGEEVVRCLSQTNSFLLLFFTSVTILVKIHQEMRAWECKQMDTRTQANWFLADVNSRSRLLYAIGRPSVVCLSSVCNVGAPYSGDWNFPQFFSPYDSPGTLVFWCQKSLVKDAPFSLKFAFKVTHPPFKQRNFDQYRLIAPQPW